MTDDEHLFALPKEGVAEKSRRELRCQISSIRSKVEPNVPGGNRASRETARWTNPRSGERAGASELIEVHVNAFRKESLARGVKEAAFPAGIEPTFKV